VKTVFVDIDTQLDFVFPAGALYVPGAENLVSRFRQLRDFAAQNQIQILSTTDAHTENDPEFTIWKPHCVAGTAGQQKCADTLLENRIVLTTAPGALDEIRPRLQDAAQIIVEKQQLDCFTNPHFRPLLDLIGADRYVVYGVVTEYCVRCAAFGLLETGKRVELVTDAIQSLNPAAGNDVLAKFTAQGGVLQSTERILAGEY
jgi:nicotinamidase/pyrazinamidase